MSRNRMSSSVNIDNEKVEPVEKVEKEKEKVDQCEGKIKTVEEYLNAIDSVYKKFWGEVQNDSTIKYNSKIWYRGVRDQDYDMLPSISRNDLNVNYETIFLSKFKSKAIPYLGQSPSYPFSEGLTGYWDWMFLMQHYGVPTRLMDWSEDALVALIFAINLDATPKELAKDPAVWCLNPIKLNEAFKFNNLYPLGYIPNVEEKEVYEMFGPEQSGFVNRKPCAVYGPLNSPRIVAQKGVFTIFPYTNNMTEFDKLPDSSDYMEELIICKDSREDITEQLRKYGINYAQLFPEIEYVSKEIFEEGY
ncbi:FRG domain-containing protein [Clostridium scatologenes]|uniref:FRG domain protein n=1 Tax=Clostridium scatologenes TaxID=1548 RepID=A0A0E3M7V9_CLOSL|nr:FRG domain-containing protein [Clostridium scatologenes]AKA67559.1 FRG domain protein [Clostridium scatologenes]